MMQFRIWAEKVKDMIIIFGEFDQLSGKNIRDFLENDFSHHSFRRF
jgi:hypothetical protein